VYACIYDRSEEARVTTRNCGSVCAFCVCMYVRVSEFVWGVVKGGLPAPSPPFVCLFVILLYIFEEGSQFSSFEPRHVVGGTVHGPSSPLTRERERARRRKINDKINKINLKKHGSNNTRPDAPKKENNEGSDERPNNGPDVMAKPNLLYCFSINLSACLPACLSASALSSRIAGQAGK